MTRKKESAGSPKSVGNHTVGYGRPPVEHQIKPGERRNPKGRPKKAKPDEGNTIALFAVLLRVLDQKIDTTVRGRRKQLRILEVLVNHVVQKALSGNEKALGLLLKLVEKAGLAALDGKTGEVMRIIIEGGLPDDDDYPLAMAAISPRDGDGTSGAAAPIPT